MIDRQAIAAFCDKVVEEYRTGYILEYLGELDKFHHTHCGTEFKTLGICYLLNQAGPDGGLELFVEFLEESHRNPHYPVAGFNEFEYNDNLWAGEGSNHAARVTLLRDFSKWLKG